MGCVLRIYVENPFWAVTLRCQMQRFAVKSLSFLKKPVLYQFTLVQGELGQWKVSDHSIIIFTFVPVCMDPGCIGTFQSFKKQENIMLWSAVFHNIQVYCHWCPFSSFFISMQLVHYIKPLLPHSMQRRCYFTFEHLLVKYSIGFRLHFRWLSNF